MLITVIVNPCSQNERIEKLDEKNYKAYFNVAPEKGKANKKLVEMLSDYFKVPKGDIGIRLGKTAKEKVIEINRN
ncbi:MAG: DUF167 domain-containing protein [Patescibacteria group bacterium]|nr:DUF167 domain-containing protein [Patescibacteria group bacterium]